MSVSSAVPALNSLQRTIRALALAEPIPPVQLTEAFELVMNGEGSPAQIAALLVGLRVKGETPLEVAAVVRALRKAMVVLPADDPAQLVDTCGTGGGQVQTFNISTAAAFVAAGAGVRVAKHGNRSFTSQCGSADVLEELGVPIDVPVERMAATLREAGIVFMFAPLMHPAMRHVGPVRRELAVPTVMNIVGPLANPARAGRQVVGVADENRLPLLAGALRELGATHAMVVHGAPGMDEISPLGATRVIEIREGQATEWTIEPARFVKELVRAEDLAGGTRAENASAVLRVLRGEGSPGATAAVVLNAAAALYVSGKASSYDAGVEQARASLGSGAAMGALQRLRTAYTESSTA